MIVAVDVSTIPTEMGVAMGVRVEGLFMATAVSGVSKSLSARMGVKAGVDELNEAVEQAIE